MDTKYYYIYETRNFITLRSGVFGSEEAANAAAHKELLPGTRFQVISLLSEGVTQEVNPLLSKQLWIGFKKPGFVFECTGQLAHNPDTTFILMQVSGGQYKLFAPPENGRYCDSIFKNSQTVQDVVNFLSKWYRSVKVREGSWQIL